MKTQILSLVASLLATGALAADAAKDDPTFLDPKAAGVDYEIQGEYIGKIDDGPVGVQIIALGAGKFHGVLYPGGLPGAGFNGEKKIASSMLMVFMAC